MTASLDPYREWLEITDSRRPPTHYSILGVEQDETCADVIERHAERQKKKLAQYLQGADARLAKRLAYEIEAARSCLADADRRAAYVRQLHASQEQEQAGQPVRLRAASQPRTIVSLPAPSGSTHVAGSAVNRKVATGSVGGSIDAVQQPGGARQAFPATGTLLARRAASADSSKRRFQRQAISAALGVALIAAMAIGVAAWFRQNPDRTGTVSRQSEADPAALPPLSPPLPPPPPPPPTEAEHPPNETLSDNEPFVDEPPIQEPTDEQSHSDGVSEPPPKSPGPSRVPAVALPDPDPFAALPDAMELPDGQVAMAIGEVALTSDEDIVVALLAPDTNDSAAFALRKVAGDHGAAVWHVTAYDNGTSSALPIASIQLENRTLVFSWERQMSSVIGAERLRNCLLHLAARGHEKVIALRMPQHITAITVDLSKGSENVLIDGSNLPTLQHLILEITKLEGLTHNGAVRITPEDRRVTGREKIEFLLLEDADLHLRVVWYMQLATVGGNHAIQLTAEMVSGAHAAPFTQKRVETMLSALPRTIQRLEAGLARVEGQIRAVIGRGDSVRSGGLPPAAKQAALQLLETELESLLAQRNSILRQLGLNRRRQKVVPELAALVESINQRVSVQGRLYHLVGRHEVPILSFGRP